MIFVVDLMIVLSLLLCAVGVHGIEPQLLSRRCVLERKPNAVDTNGKSSHHQRSSSS